jgi:hypothetical protein
MTKPDLQDQPASSTRESKLTRAMPLVTLLLLSPIIAEVLFGSTSLSTLYVLVPEIGTWGCGTLLIRGLVRSRHRGWLSILLLGIALAVAEECVIQQTSLAPLPWLDPQHIYGRALGINWVYLFFQLGYESIWAVVLPIQLTELLFPSRSSDAWIRRRGLVIAAIVFLLCSLVAWYSWTQVTIPTVFHKSIYHPPLLTVVIALVVIVALAAFALGPRPSSRPEQALLRPVPQPWLIGLGAFVLSLLWFVLILLTSGVAEALPPVIPMVGGLLEALAAFFLVNYWSESPAWRDTHRLALVFGACVASMLAGFLLRVVVLPVDVIGKLVLNVIAVLLLSFLAWRICRREVQTRQTSRLP